MKKVLFLCTGNSARSQMAEGWARSLGGDIAEFCSAGSAPAAEVNPLAIAAMREVGIDLSDAFPKPYDPVDETVDLVVAVCSLDAVACPLPGQRVEVERWDLPDPAAATGTDEERMAVFRASRDEIERRVRDLMGRLA